MGQSKGGLIKMKLLKRLFMEEEGVTLIEYALIAALIAVVAIVALQFAGTQIRSMFSYIAEEIQDAM